MKLTVIQDWFSKLPHLSQMLNRYDIEEVKGVARKLNMSAEKKRRIEREAAQELMSSSRNDTEKRREKKKQSETNTKREEHKAENTEQTEESPVKGTKVDRFA